jgi:hypothetical protein
MFLSLCQPEAAHSARPKRWGFRRGKY